MAPSSPAIKLNKKYIPKPNNTNGIANNRITKSKGITIKNETITDANDKPILINQYKNISNFFFEAICKKCFHAGEKANFFRYIIGTTKSYTKNINMPITIKNKIQVINIGINNQ